MADLRPLHLWSEPPGSGAAARITPWYFAEDGDVLSITESAAEATHAVDLSGDVASIVPAGSAASPARQRRAGTRYLLY